VDVFFRVFAFAIFPKIALDAEGTGLGATKGAQGAPVEFTIVGAAVLKCGAGSQMVVGAMRS
jgi:hypothetical protein